MKIKCGQYITFLMLLLASNSCIFSQLITDPDLRISSGKLSLNSKSRNTKHSKEFDLSSKTSAVLPVSIGVLTAVYLLNPIAEYTNRKVYAGLTKEVSIGWGKLGEHRTTAEYSMIFGGNIRNYLRFSYKYDILLAQGIQPSHMLQGTAVVSLGAGYFTDFNGEGIFPEITYGYSIRNHRFLFYPHVKFRHTFMITKDKPDITDLSFGIILGIANPFLDVDIKRIY
jgi:hypothetical protein